MASRENPVEFLLSNKEILALVFVAFAWLAQKLGMTKGKAELPGSRPKAAAAADDEAARTRRVQEEVRRRIAERRAGVPPALAPSRSTRVPAPSAAPRPVPSTPSELWGELFRGETQEAPADRTAQEPELEPIPARRSEIEIKMRQLESASSFASAEAGGISSDRPASPIMDLGAPAPVASNAWLSMLREQQGARRAIVLREVLGPPVGLRR